MRMKRILSLMLATLILASMTISVSAASKVYLYEDFSSYETIRDFIVTMQEMDERSTAGAIRQRDAGRNFTFGASNGVGDLANADASTITASFETSSGIKWFEFYNHDVVRTETVANMTNSVFYVLSDDTWDYTDNKDEIFIVSYDFKVVPPAEPIKSGDKTTSYSMATIWATDGETSSVEDSWFAIERPANQTYIDLIPYKDANKNESERFTLTANEPYKLAVGFNYAYAADEVTPLNYPYKSIAVNGEVIQNSTNPGQAKNTFTNLLGIKLLPNAYMGEHIANVKMYTVDSAFAVSALDDTIGILDKITVKFSHPIYESSFDKEDLIVRKAGGSAISNVSYDVSDVRTVVDESTDEIYSAFDISFKYGLEPNASYEIVVPNTVKNEIGTTISNNVATFSTENPANTISSFVTDTGATTFTAGMNTFTATAGVGNARAYLIVGIYNGDVLESYTFATASEGETLSFSSEIESGKTVKAFSAGELINLSALSAVSSITE